MTTLLEHWRIRDKGSRIEKLEYELERTKNSLSILWEMYNRMSDNWNSVFKLQPQRWEFRPKDKLGKPREPEGPSGPPGPKGE